MRSWLSLVPLRPCWRSRLASSAPAQNGGIVGPGNAVVTGFAGTVAAPAPPGEDPFDHVTINPDGPSAEVIDLSNLGPQGQLSDALKTFAVSAAQVGQVFGVAIDNAPQPNIYLAATSAYGLSIYLPDGTPTVRRIRVGTPGAQFVPGQFGPAGYGGSPGSIWRIDGVTGEAYLFANVDAAATGAASLGGLAFDPGLAAALRRRPRDRASSTASGSTGTSGGPTTTASRGARRPASRRCPMFPAFRSTSIRPPSAPRLRRPGASRRRAAASSRSP